MRFSSSFSLNRNFADDFCRYGGGVSFFSQEVKMIQILSVGAGGFIGAVLRFFMGKLPLKEMTIFPVNTLLINLIGAFAIGLVTAAGSRYGAENSNLVLFLKVGLCGGFTTFSTFSLESLALIQEGRFLVFMAYAVSSVALCLLAVWLGHMAAALI